MISVVRASERHCDYVAAHMRPEDAAEAAAFGLTPLNALRDSLVGAAVAETALVHSVPCAMWGANPITTLTGDALLWMLGTAEVPRHKRALLRMSREFVDRVAAKYDPLYCVVNADYASSIRWVKWLGFREISRPRAGNVPVITFERRRA